METIVNMTENADKAIKEEPSRIVRFIMVKYKCILIMALLLLIILHFLSQTLISIFRGDETTGRLLSLLEMFVNVTKYVENAKHQKIN
jgi:hypothetical protein